MNALLPQDYMERQAIEMEREMLREERASQAALNAANNMSQQGSSQTHLTPEHHNDGHTNVVASLSIPGSDPSISNHHAFRRCSSLKLSRRKSKSVGPSHKRKGSFQRTGSVDTPSDKEDVHTEKPLVSCLKKTKEGSSAPAISGEENSFQTSFKHFLKRKESVGSGTRFQKHSPGTSSSKDGTKTHILKSANAEALEKKESLDVASASTFGEHNNLLKVPVASSHGGNFLTVPNAERGSTEFLSTSKTDSSTKTPQEPLLSPSVSPPKSSVIPRPGRLLLKECYPPKTESSSTSQLPPPVPTVTTTTASLAVGGANGPLTNVEVHYVDSSNPSSSTDLLDNNPRIDSVSKLLRLQLPLNSDTDIQNENGSQKSSHCHIELQDLSGKKDKNVNGIDKSLSEEKKLPHPEIQTQTTKLSSIDKNSSSLPLLKKSSPFSSSPNASLLSKKHIVPNCVLPPNHLTVNNVCLKDIGLPMQPEDKSNALCPATENRILLGAECSLLCCDTACKDNATDNSNKIDGYTTTATEVVVTDEIEDGIDSMTELISDSFREEILAKTSLKSKIISGSSHSCRGATPKSGYENSIHSPEDEEVWPSRASSRKGSGSLASISKSSRSGSGRRSGSSKVKSPTSTNWMVLKTPLARIESFHSDDFDCLTGSEHLDCASSPSISPMSATTPTVPCFAYKLHMMKKKQTKLKINNSNGKDQDSPRHNLNKECANKTLRNNEDKKQNICDSTIINR